MRSILGALVAGLVLVHGQGWAEERVVPESAQEVTLSFAPLVRQAAPAVVNIYATRTVRQAVSPLFNDPFFERFFGRAPPGLARQQNALGSGVIVRSDGLVVTNHHVIADADAIKVVLTDRSEYAADVILSDERTDLAVLQLRDLGDRELPFLPPADSTELEVGDLVLAIGNPFGVGQTVTSGIVSALARTSVGISDYNFFIQTDAAINPGNSGGALIAMDGGLVGINTAIYSRTGGSLGIGFAIPSNMVRSVIQSIERGTPLARPWLGADVQLVTADIARALGLDHPGGVLVSSVEPGGPAARAGVLVGDVIVAVDHRPIDDPNALRFHVATLPLDGTASLSVWRNGEAIDLTMEVELPPEDPPRQVTPLTGPHPFAGATVANLSPALVAEQGFDGPNHGVVVLSVAPRSPAHRLRLQPGDVFLRVNGERVEDVDGLVRVLGAGSPGGWRVSIRRDGETLETVVYG